MNCRRAFQVQFLRYCSEPWIASPHRRIAHISVLPHGRPARRRELAPRGRRIPGMRWICFSLSSSHGSRRVRCPSGPPARGYVAVDPAQRLSGRAAGQSAPAQ